MRGFGRLGILGNWVLDFWGLGFLEYEVGRGFGFQCCILVSAIGFWVLQRGRCGEKGSVTEGFDEGWFGLGSRVGFFLLFCSSLGMKMEREGEARLG